jgi:hypothetical protein
MKKPWIAAILNLLFFGAGYIYNGKRTGFGIALIVGWILIRLGEIPIFLTHLVFEKWLVMFIGIVVLQISFATNAYNEAKGINGK